MNEVAPLPGNAADDEADAIAEFVLGGGCLAIITDTLEGGQGVVMGNKAPAAIDGGSGLSLVSQQCCTNAVTPEGQSP